MWLGIAIGFVAGVNLGIILISFIRASKNR